MMETEKEIDVTVSDVVVVNDLVKRFHFKRRAGGDLPAFSGGAHIVVEMDDDGIRRLNPYSLMGDPFDLSQFTISVRRDAEGRGGSRFMHDRVQVGDRMTISPPPPPGHGATPRPSPPPSSASGSSAGSNSVTRPSVCCSCSPRAPAGLPTS